MSYTTQGCPNIDFTDTPSTNQAPRYQLLVFKRVEVCVQIVRLPGVVLCSRVGRKNATACVVLSVTLQFIDHVYHTAKF
jgi:hypothetical protein